MLNYRILYKRIKFYVSYQILCKVTKFYVKLPNFMQKNQICVIATWNDMYFIDI